MCALAWATRHDPFFWDTVQLASKHAHFFYEQGLQWKTLPAAIDSGHPPVFGYYLAVVWVVFGKTLPVSHFAVLPFLLLNVLLLWRIGRRIAGEAWGAFLPLLVFADPVLLGQSAMVSPDIVVVAGFLLAVEGISGNSKTRLVVGVLLLCALSMRGMMTAGALAAWVVYLQWRTGFDAQKILLAGLPFIPGFAFAAWFIWWHWTATGWIGYHAGSPWAGAFNRVGATGVVRNIAVVGWRWLDLGRVGELATLAALTMWFRRRLGRFPKDTHHLFALWVCLILFLTPSGLLYQNLTAHRYFLPGFLALHLLVFQWITSEIAIPKVRAWLLGSLVAVLLSGNLWIYPRGISMDWDSTLAHWPYHGLRSAAVAFLEKERIDFRTVGTTFPNVNTGENLLLNGDQRSFANKNFDQNQYMFTSNVFNDFSGEDYQRLRQDWRLIWQQEQRGVWVEIYARK